MASERRIGRAVALATLWASGAAVVGAFRVDAPAAAAFAICGSLLLFATLAWPRSPINWGVRSGAPRSQGLQSLQAAWNHSPGLLLGLRSDGRVDALNRAARTYFGEERVSALRVAMFEPLAPGSSRVVGLDPPGEHPVCDPGAGRDGPYQLGLVLTPGLPGFRALALLTDVSGPVHKAQAAALRDLLRVLGHEVMNSLAPISAMAETLPQRVAEQDHEGIVEASTLIAQKIRAIRRFADSYRELAQLPPPLVQRVDASRLARAMERLFVNHWGGKVRLAVDVRAGGVRLDEDLVGQAIWALLENAARAAAANPSPLVTLRLHGGQPFRIEVSDNGPGVDPAVEGRMFDLFATTRRDGSGVGLSLARQIAHSHGGDVTFQRLDPGSRFSIVLP